MIQDIYFTAEYARINEFIESGKAEEFVYSEKFGSISNIFIKREIPFKVDNVTYFDIVTPYGYGGPRITELSDISKKQILLNSYENSFRKYCNDNNIVSEFVRFHPLFGNGECFKSIYNSEHIRNTLGTNLTFEDPIAAEFSKSCKKNIRQAINKGVTYKVTPAPDDITGFIDIYYSTMDRNKADEFYYFGDEYFRQIHEAFKENLLFVEAVFEGKTIAAGLYFIYNKMIHIHLSGTLSQYLYLSPAYILRYAVTLWGKEHGYELIHHGGGRSNSPEDSLFLFKKQFAQQTEFNYYIGKKIWNEAIYLRLCEGIDTDDGFFPAYRRKA